jgi:hypothetical protein
VLSSNKWNIFCQDQDVQLLRYDLRLPDNPPAQTSNLGVGGSNPSERAIQIKRLAIYFCSGCHASYQLATTTPFDTTHAAT